MRIIPTAISTADILKVLSVDKLKQNQRLLSDVENDVLQDIIIAAYDYLSGPNGWLRRCLMPQQFTIYTDGLCNVTEIPVSPLISVTGVEYLDDTGTWQTSDPALYRTIPSDTFSSIGLLANQSWPLFPQIAASGRLTVSAGFANENVVPPVIKRGMILLAGHLFQNREATYSDQRVTFVSRKVQFGMDELCGRWRIMNDACDPEDLTL